ncbi:hemagglutinin repeat-containing protein [Variovorax sp. ZS18.2.2]|uniref:two-partner secretion domain-containing protein n=1 Tax=Variovorax sp. ZS18.2.2 TaxID=2971255 RepID=UPI002151A785|nr:hemagglutinin repeat-containing protein [Variovorax sp. ZS18.2.2]MCR6480417.1 hemagglutinin repeat-containing protein [Variovorax sp. ZS18.2.2]
MNKHLHRIIFNAARGMRMVVQETATSIGKGAAKATVSAAVGTVALLGPMFVGAGLTGVLTASPARAQIVPSPMAPSNLRPNVLVAPNGVPLVNIRTPSAGGVSRNVYNQFDVMRNGAILNNSRGNVQTQLGGWVQGNPWLANGPARIILNEINGGNPSQLRGYVEVGGQRAEVIIANPAGISVDGGGFINASRATLTTGTPQLNAFGGLESFLVRGGTVAINGAGLDASKTDYAAILARAVEANAGIWASELKVVTGANQVSADHSQIAPTAGTGAAPTFALDVAALGGMYAGKIVLVGTEAGLGARNAGTIQAVPGAASGNNLAGAGQLVVTHAGRLENTGSIQATADANLAAPSFANSGRVVSGGNLKIATQDNLTNSLHGAGGTLEGGRLELSSAAGDIDNRAGLIRQTSSTGLALSAATLSNTSNGVIGLEPVSQGATQPNGEGSGTGTPGTPGTSTPPAESGTGSTSTIAPAPYTPPSPGAVTAAGAIRNDNGGRIYAGGPISLQSANINNNGGTMGLASMTVNQPTFDNHGGTLNISNGFNAHVDRFDNTGGKLNAGSLNIASSGDLINVDGTLASAADVHLSIGGKADNTQGTVSAVGTLAANVTGATTNDAGTLIANQGLTLQTASLDNSKGSIQSVQAGVRLAVANQLANGGGGVIGAATDLNVQAGSLVNAGSLRGANDVNIAVSDVVGNEGTITAGRHAAIAARSLQSNSAGVLGAGIQADGSLGGIGDLHITTTGALIAQGNNLAGGNVTLQGANVDLAGSQTSAANIAITATQDDVTTSKAVVVTPGILNIAANAQSEQTLVNDAGKLNAAQWSLNISNLANTNGAEIIQTGTGTTTVAISGTLDNSGGTLASNGRLALAAASLSNKGGTIRTAPGTDLAITVTGLLDNSSKGEIGAGGNATVQAASLDNDTGRIVAVGDVSSTTSGATSNQGGSIAANGNTTLTAGNLNNTGGTVSALSNLATTVQGALDNAAGTLVANQALEVDAGLLTNGKGSIQSLQASTRLDVTGGLTNEQGAIGAAADLSIQADQLTNSGSLHGGNDTSVTVTERLTNDGSITAGRNTGITAGSVQSGGSSVLGAGIQSDGNVGVVGDLSVSASGALLAQGTNLAAGQATLQGANVDLTGSQTSAANIAITATQSSVITSTAKVVTPGTLSVTANAQTGQTLVNDAGQLSAGQLNLRVSNIANTHGGEIVQVGDGATTIAVSGMLNNDGGRIASNGQDLSLSAATLTNTSGKIEHAGSGTLSIAGGDYSGVDGQITTNKMLTVAMEGAFRQDGGTTGAEQIAIDAGSLSNRGGQIVQTGADAMRITVADALDNTLGTIASNGKTIIAADSLTNRGGTIRAAGTSDLDVAVTGALDNSQIKDGDKDKGGEIGAGGNAVISAGSLNNTFGGITAAGDLVATIGGAAINVGGTLAANGNTTVIAGTLDNSNLGVVAAVNGDLTVTTTGTTTNNGGTLQAGGKTALANNGLNNVGGKIFGDSLSVDTRGNTLDNSAKGTLAATTTVAVNSGVLNNDAGLIQSGGAMTIDTHGQALVNTNAAGYRTDPEDPMGGISSSDALTIDAGVVNNKAGFIGAAGALTASTKEFSNTGGGTVLGRSTVAIDTAGAAYDNGGGQTLAAGDLSIDAGSINNADGLIRSSATTSLNARTLVNADTLIANRGIEGKNVVIGADDLNNAKGGIRADQNVTITSGGNVRNDQGLISAMDTLAIKDPNAGNPGAKTLSITNTNGTLVGGTAAVRDADGKVQTAGFGGVWLDARSFVNDGKLVSANDLGVALVGDTTNRSEVAANGNLSYTTTGTFVNDGKLLAGQTLTVGGNEVFNNANAEMSGANTIVNAASKLENRGLIDSVGQTQINAGATSDADGTLTGTGTVRNIGTGRIYGDRISIVAGSLDNDAETVNGETKAGTIAARKRLDIGAQTVNNREHAMIFSGDTLFVGGALDSKREATGRATEIVNASASIESLGDMSLAASRVRNLDAHIRTEEVTGAPEHRVEHAPKGETDRLSGGSFTPKPKDAYYTTIDGQRIVAKNWYIWEYDRTKTTTEIVPGSADPGRIVAGGNLTFKGDELRNESSKIVIGGALTGDVGALRNIGIDGVERTRDVGKVTYSYTKKGGRKYGFFGPRKDIRVNDTTDYDVQQPDRTFTLDEFVFKEHANEASDKRPGAARAVSVSAQAGAAGEVDGANRNGAIVEVPSAIGAVEKSAGDTVNAMTGEAAKSNTDPVNGTATALNVNGVETNGGTTGPKGTGGASAPPMVVRTSLPNLTVPTASLFGVRSAGGGYLVETDPRFANYRNWLSSDYLLNSLGTDPNNTLKRLGDGFYEQKLIREQVAQLTGYRYLDGFQSDEDQYAALMDSGAAFAKQYGLRPGVALSAAQMAQLTSDIVWLVEQTVTLPDGTSQKVLAPQVYVRVRPGDINGSGALISAGATLIKSRGDVTNTGTIAGRNIVAIHADNIDNLGGRIDGSSVRLDAARDLNNIGGSITARDSAVLQAGRDINIQTTTTTQAGVQGIRTGIDRVAGVYVTNPGGLLVASAGNDLNVVGAILVNAGKDGNTVLAAERNVKLGTVTTASSDRTVWDPKNFRSENLSAEVGSQVQTAGAVQISAGNDIRLRAASVDAKGAVVATAGRDVAIEDGKSTLSLDEAHQYTTKGFLFKEKIATRDQVDRTDSVASNVGGSTVSVAGGNDIRVVGSNVVSDNGTTLVAKNNLSIEAAINEGSERHDRQEKRSGLLGTGGIGFMIGTQQQAQDGRTQTTTAARSTVGSVNGNTTLVAGNQYVQTGSDVMSPQGDVTIAAKNIRIQEARETSRTDTEQRQRTSGLTVALSNPILDAAQSAVQTVTTMGETSNARMQALGAATIALQTRELAKSIAANPSQATGINISISLGTSKSQSNSSEVTDTSVGSKVVGNNVTLLATGGGKDSNISVQGSDITAARNATLVADNEVNILAAKNDAERHSKNSSSSASVGVSVGTSGLMFNAGASGGKGKSDGSDTSYTNSHVKAGDTVNIVSGGDTNIRGGVVEANRVNADIGGNLLIESLQDTSKSDSKQQSAGGSISIGAGVWSANVNLSNAKAKGDHASVTEQSGIKAGDGGFDVDVKGHTELKGGVIESTQAAINAGRNRFDTASLAISDIENRDNYKASGYTVGIGYTSQTKDANGNTVPARTGGSAGSGKESGSQDSVTKAGISGIAGDQSVRTGVDSTNALVKTWNTDSLVKDVAAQARITQGFGQVASKAIGDYANARAEALRREGKIEEAKMWDEGGTYRVLAHAVVGGLTGDVQGAAGAAFAAAAAPTINELTKDLPDGVKGAVGAGIAAGLGIAVGGTAGGVAAYNSDTNNRQLHSEEGRLIRENARDYAVKRGFCKNINECTQADIELAQSELTIQALKNVDISFKDVENNADADAFLKEVAAKNGPNIPSLCPQPPTALCGSGQSYFEATDFGSALDGSKYRDSTINLMDFRSNADLYANAQRIYDLEHIYPLPIWSMVENARIIANIRGANERFDQMMAPWEIFNGIFGGLGPRAPKTITPRLLEGLKAPITPTYGRSAFNISGWQINEILGWSRSGSALKSDPVHRAASYLSREQLAQGTSFTMRGGDGSWRSFFQVPGQMNGKNGIFEFVLDPLKGVTHQRFVNGGRITGLPNQRVPPP